MRPEAAEELEITPLVTEPPPFDPVVAESEAVEDAWFEAAAFLCDSRTQGFMLYSGLNYGTYYYSQGATVDSVFHKAVATPAGEMPLLDRKSTRLNSSHDRQSRMPSSAWIGRAHV